MRGERRPGWAIVDLGEKLDSPRRYINRQWDEHTEAWLELQQLLVPYPKDDPWRKRLVVAFCDGKYLDLKREAPSPRRKRTA